METIRRPLPPRFSCRRLLSSDRGDLAALQRSCFAATAQPTAAELEDDLRLGEIWGIFEGRALAGSVTLLPLGAVCRPCLAAAELVPLAGLLQADRASLVCDLALAPGGEDAAALTAALLAAAADRALAAGRDGGLLAAVPVKGAPPLGPFFDAGYRLAALRPMLRLCACFIFALAPQGETTYNKEDPAALRCPLSETKRLGRYLEEGWRGVALSPGGELLLAR